MSTQPTTKPQYEPVDASPVKSFFVSMLTRDIKLEEAILDLLDNCVDGILRKRGQVLGTKPYKSYRAEIEFNKDMFTISDNCGGIPWSLHDYAFLAGEMSVRAQNAVYAVIQQVENRLFQFDVPCQHRHEERLHGEASTGSVLGLSCRLCTHVMCLPFGQNAFKKSLPPQSAYTVADEAETMPLGRVEKEPVGEALEPRGFAGSDNSRFRRMHGPKSLEAARWDLYRTARSRTQTFKGKACGARHLVNLALFSNVANLRTTSRVCRVPRHPSEPCRA